MPADPKPQKKQPAASKPRRTHSHLLDWRWWRGVALRIASGFAIIGLLALGGIVFVYSRLAADYDLSKLGSMPERTVVYDRKGNIIGKLHGENRNVIALSEVSPHFIKAIVAREDSRFYQHGGVDFKGIIRAMLRNLRDGKVVQGASTITMQLARNSYPGLDDRSMHRKLIEVMLARRIEAYATKDQILDAYVNRIFFGSGLYGIQRAATVYFGKHASQLNLSEAALIAGVVRGPGTYSPFKNWEGAKRERDTVLDRMVFYKVLTQAEADEAKKADIALHAQPLPTSQGAYAMDAVKRDLDLILEARDKDAGGLRVFTTLDADLQNEAETSLEARSSAVEKLPGYPRITKAAFDAQWDHVTQLASAPYLQGALTAIHNSTGGILAIVGGRDYSQSQYNRAIQGERQIGSTIKPFVYATAIARGVLPGTFISDDPIPGDWSPGNSDGKNIGQQPMALGLIQSRNTMTVRVGDQAGLARVLETLGRAGILGKGERSRQIFIGNIGSSVRNVTTAFTTFPNGGNRVRPYLIERIEDHTGQVLYATLPEPVEVLSPGAAYLTSRLLSLVMNEGTAAAVRNEHGFEAPGGGKTGTTNDYKDAWFVGYTQEVTCGVWLGCDQPQTIMNEAYGGKLALPVWADVMKKAQALGYITAAASEPPLTRVDLCRVSSLLATPACSEHQASYPDDLPFELVPQAFCPVHGVGGSAPPAQLPARRSSGGVWSRLKGLFGG